MSETEESKLLATAFWEFFEVPFKNNPDRIAAPVEVAPSNFGAIALFTATIFLSAILLFSIQPLFAKMVLPILGGTPSVWAVALCFFQGALLVGYAYAHLLVRFLSLRRAGLVHLVVCGLALFSLPIAVPDGWREPPTGEPYFWQLGLFTVAIGAPFVAVAANAPLLQAMFAALERRRGRDPYFLYAASNLGSLLALLSFPLLLEPLAGLRALSQIWTYGFGLLVAALVVCVLFLCNRRETLDDARSLPNNRSPDASLAAQAVPSPTWAIRAAWMGLALVPSGLLTAFTTHLSTDIASAPLLWVIPLALYLATFVAVFRWWPPWLAQGISVLHLLAVLASLLYLSQSLEDIESFLRSTVLGFLAFVTTALSVHRTLYETRPAPRHLTEFYLFMSLGGALGGVFAGLIAPKIFSELYEYPLLLALGVFGSMSLWRTGKPHGSQIGAAALILGSCAILIPGAPKFAAILNLDFGVWGVTPVLAGSFALLAGLASLWPWPQAALVFCMMLTVVLLPSGVKRGNAERSYFGIYRVSPFLDDSGTFNVLTHGTTLHGAQLIRDPAGDTPTDTVPGTYYYPGSPMARAIGIVRGAALIKGRVGRYGVVGLGAGSLACLSAPGETWRFFEIDPVVVGIAQHSNYFTYLANCQPEPDIVMGDARLTIAKEPGASFDLILVDAFTSDAVPIHLMTAEAIVLYLSKLNETGILVLHISNRYLDLDNVLGATLAKLPGVHGLLVSDDAANGTYAQENSTIAVFAKNMDSIEPFRTVPGAAEFNRDKLTPWTDDSSDILGPFLSKQGW